MASLSENPNSRKDILFILGAIILFLSFLVLIVASGIMFYKYPKQQKTCLIEMTVIADSTKGWSEESKKMADSIVHVVASQNKILSQKYDHVLQLQEDKETLYMFGGVILSIVLSIFGFFGYRSFKSIEDTAISNAEGMAKKKLDDEMIGELERLRLKLNSNIVKRFEKIKEEDLPNAVESEMVEHYNKNIDAKLQYLNTFKEKIDNLQKKVDEHDKLYNDAKDEGIVTSTDETENDTVKILKERKKGGKL